ncbi:MAG: LytTR family transcriptional regulator DNA-binding domain-containing protein [Ruminococcus sp.]|nr:LytTR family transcriptional regulator DNA-binding domain-containing protein [Ruminococcus sp.]
MKKMNVRFEQDKTLGDIDIVIRASEQDEQVKALVESLSRQKSAKLTVFDRDGCTCMIEEEKIVMVSADGKNVRVTATDGIYKAKQSLQNMEELLSRRFLRVSRFELVNLEMVHKYDFTIGGTLRIEFDNGMETWASRRYIPLIRERLSSEEGYLC